MGKQKLLLLAFAVVTIGCGSLYKLPSSSTSNSTSTSTSAAFKKTCASGDLDCYLLGFFMDEEGEGNDLQIISSDLPSASMASMAGTVPSIVSVSQSSLQFTSSSDKQDLSITWNDPNGAQPAFCMRTCNPNVRCSSFSLCRRSIPDGLVSGVWRTAPYYTVGPATSGTTETMTMEFTPISMPGGADPVETMKQKEDEEEDGDADFSNLGMSVGEATTVVNKVVAPKQETTDTDENGDTGGDTGGDNGGGTSGNSCTSQSGCGTGYDCFSSRSCVKGAFSCECSSAAASSGTCYSGVTCSGSGGTCGDGTHACCVGLTCTNGTCEGAGGRCP